MFICERAPKKLNASSREEHIPQILTALLCIYRVDTLYLTFIVFCLLPVIRKQRLEQYNYSDIQSALMTSFRTRQILRHQYEISVAESQTFLLANRPPAAMSEA